MNLNPFNCTITQFARNKAKRVTTPTYVRTVFYTEAGPAIGTIWLDVTDKQSQPFRVDKVNKRGGLIYGTKQGKKIKSRFTDIARGVEHGSLVLVGVESEGPRSITHFG